MYTSIKRVCVCIQVYTLLYKVLIAYTSIKRVIPVGMQLTLHGGYLEYIGIYSPPGYLVRGYI